MKKTRDVIKTLLDYNPDADVEVVINNKGYDFSFSWGSSDGVTKANCDIVSLFVDEFNISEQHESERE